MIVDYDSVSELSQHRRYVCPNYQLAQAFEQQVPFYKHSVHQ